MSYWFLTIAAGFAAVAMLSSLSLAQATRPARLTIVLAGDSTVTDTAGWGLGFAHLLKADVHCVNLAKGGRSSRSFRDEGWWKQVLETRGDYVLIQFGHNDQPGKGPERETDPNTTFRENLTRYIQEARAAGMKPVLVTSLTRRRYKDGKIDSDLTPYAEATLAVAEKEKIPVIDLHKVSIEFFDKIGEAEADKLSPRDKDGKVDHTHLNKAGGEAVGKLVRDELAKVVPELADAFK